MWIGLLGPLVAVDDAGAAVRLPGARLRVLLAALALSAGKPVAGDALAELVWDAAPPPGFAATLRSHVVRLRRALPGARIEAGDTGYTLSGAGLSLDVAQFGALCSQAGVALRAGEWDKASRAAAGALGLWRGAPLVDVPSQLLRDRAVPRLERLRAQVVEDRAEADLRLGRYGQVAGDLREAVAAHPLRERLHAQLMLALYHGGRQAEALVAYRDARTVLVDELGIEPGPDLRRVHERILAGHSDPGAPQRSADPQSAVRPRQLPAAAGHFTGRREELELLLGLAGSPQPADAPGGTVVICAVDGMAGIGKTALAVHAAHRLADRFDGGQLFIDLHGYTQGHPPREPGQALDTLLRSLGVPPAQIPKDTEERATLYRQRLSGTRTLIVLDNALTEAQVRPLLPGEAGCLALITSRRRLKGLDDAHSLPLDLLPPAQAAALLRAVAGASRVAADNPLLGEIARLCGHLPLALRIAGALLRHRPAWGLDHLATLLRDQRRRVDALADGERELGVVFDLSYAGLDGQHRVLFRRLGLVPGPHVDAYAAAALLECDPDTATGLLEDLVDHNLLIAHAPGRYRLHDLIRAHAAALAAGDPEGERDAALNRLLHYYAHTAQTASIPLARHPKAAADGPAPTHAPTMPGPRDARAWLRAERENLEAASAHARTCALHGHAIALADGLAEILRSDGPFTRALQLHQDAADTAERHSHPAAHANALIDLGTARRLTGDLPGAFEAFTRALVIHRETGNRNGQANALAILGGVRGQTGELSRGAEDLTLALEIYRETGNRNGQATVLNYLGTMRHVAGDLPEATEALSLALEIYRETGNLNGEANALAGLGRVRQWTGDLSGAAEALGRALDISHETGNLNYQANALSDLGRVRRLTGDLPAAGDALARAVEICRAIGHRSGEAIALSELGRVRHQAGDLSGASAALSQALDIFRETGHRSNEAYVLNHYAATVLAANDLPRARTLFQQALAMNRELNKPDDEAVALEGLGECRLATGDTGRGADHLNQALEIFQRLGMSPDAARVRSRLAGLAAA